MKCPRSDCDGSLRVKYTNNVLGSKIQDAVCNECDRRFVLLTQIVQEIEKRGEGLHAFAKQLKAKTR